MDLIFALAAASFYTVGGAFMKQSAGLTQPWPSLWLFACFVAGAALQTLSMRGGEMSSNLIIVLGLEAALALGLGLLLFGESLSPGKAAGVLLVVAGAALLRQA